MQSLLFAEFAELLQLQALFVLRARTFFIAPGLVIYVVANRAFHIEQMVLGHRLVVSYQLIVFSYE